jgi:hypothetical protein
MSEAPDLNMPGAHGRQIKTGDHCPVTLTEEHQHIPETGQQRTVIIVLFVLLAISLAINCLDYARGQRNDEIVIQHVQAADKKVTEADQKVAEAEKGVHVQDWADADTLSKENAEIRGQVIAIELILESRWGIEIPKPNPLPPRLRQEKH